MFVWLDYKSVRTDIYVICTNIDWHFSANITRDMHSTHIWQRCE